jgi:hypothetical protein
MPIPEPSQEGLDRAALGDGRGLLILLASCGGVGQERPAPTVEKRWPFVWRDLSDPHGGLKGADRRFLADRGLRQILSGCYEGDEDGSAIAEWIENTRDVPGIVGAMHTLWEDHYDAMDTWAQRASGGGGG